MKHTLLKIGHRGAMGYATENTLVSIDKAISLGCDMIEVDVFQIKSGELVLFHDQDLNRLAHIDKPIQECTLSELRAPKYTQRILIPTLVEAIDLIAEKAILNIELKAPNTAKHTYSLLKDYINKGWSPNSFLISSFIWDELTYFSKQDILIPTAILTEHKPLQTAITFAKHIQATAINPYYKLVNAQDIQQIHKLGFKVYPWTANTKNDILLLKELKVDGIITNFPDLI